MCNYLNNMDIVIPYGRYKGCDIEELLKDSAYVKWIVHHVKDSSDFYEGIVSYHYANLYEQALSGVYLDHRIADAIKLRGMDFLMINGFGETITKFENYGLDDEFLWFINTLHKENASIAGKFLSYFYRTFWTKMSGKSFVDSDVEAVLTKYENLDYKHMPEHVKKVKNSYKTFGHFWDLQALEIYDISTCYSINRYGNHNTNHEEKIHFFIPDDFKQNFECAPRDLFEKLIISQDDWDIMVDKEMDISDFTKEVDTNPNFIYNGIKAEIDVINKDSIFIFKTVKKLDMNFMAIYLTACACIINKCDSGINISKGYVMDFYNQKLYTVSFHNMNSVAILKTLEIV